jgi:D-alanyl-D-alanine carboxypeptidase/D-alanyl-D-alanine-endopeptidase (penicillin-binding protein 4)
MFYNIATIGGHRPARAIDATRQERALIERCGLDASQYRLADGSGLSLYNYLSAELEVALLRYAYHRVDIYEKLIPSLPIAGNDGTLKKRMKGTLAENNVQAKTGTLTGVISLAGYLTAANGHRLCFSIMNQGTLKASDAREFKDKICTILCEP